MKWKAEELEPLNGKLIVKRDPPPEELGGIAVPKIAVVRRPCKDCHGGGCFIRPIYEEDGIWISRHEEIRCERCDGRGYREAVYDPRPKVTQWTATVVSVGPGKPRRKFRLSDARTLWWKPGRETLPVSAGDRVVVAPWSGVTAGGCELGDGYWLIQSWEVLAVLGRVATVPPLPAGCLPEPATHPRACLI